MQKYIRSHIALTDRNVSVEEVRKQVINAAGSTDIDNLYIFVQGLALSVSIPAILRCNWNISSLAISYNDRPPHGLVALAKAVRNAAYGIRELHILGTLDDDDEIGACAEILLAPYARGEHVPVRQLREIMLPKPRTIEHMAALMRAVHANDNIIKLELSFRPEHRRSYRYAADMRSMELLIEGHLLHNKRLVSSDAEQSLPVYSMEYLYELLDRPRPGLQSVVGLTLMNFPLPAQMLPCELSAFTQLRSLTVINCDFLLKKIS